MSIKIEPFLVVDAEKSMRIEAAAFAKTPNSPVLFTSLLFDIPPNTPASELQHVISQRQQQLQTDPNLRMTKVVDNGEMIAFAQWFIWSKERTLEDNAALHHFDGPLPTANKLAYA